MTSPTSQELASGPCNIYSVLSHKDNLKIFAIAKDGLKISPSLIDKLDISPKAYYRALKQLKDAGLVGKKKDKGGNIKILSYDLWVYCISKKRCRDDPIYAKPRKNADD
jgi:DNA-binding MarR family transcriptional regulator